MAVIALDTIQQTRQQQSHLNQRLASQLKPSHWVAALVLCFAAGGLHTIPSGHEGVVETMGEAQEKPLDGWASPSVPTPNRNRSYH